MAVGQVGRYAQNLGATLAKRKETSRTSKGLESLDKRVKYPEQIPDRISHPCGREHGAAASTPSTGPMQFLSQDYYIIIFKE
jgi:hypothetical protein